MLTILVTGAAGLIGGEVCARAAARGHKVVALVHRNREVRGNDGQTVGQAQVIGGDVRAEGLALTAPCPAPDVVIHCAASLTFDAPEAELTAINVGGARNVAAFAAAEGARLVHVSTAYVCGWRDGPVAEAPVPPGTRFANGYEASKARGEEAVRASDAAHCIARPSVVLGDTASGAIRQFDAIYQAFALIARGMVPALPVRAGASLDFVPIDYVAEGLVRLAESGDAAQGTICHLASGAPMPVADFAAAIAAFPQFRAPTLVDADAFDPAALTPSQARVFARVAGAYASYFQRDPRFVVEQAGALTGLAAPLVGPEWFARLIGFAVAGGLLPSAHRGKTAPASPAPQAPTAHPL